MPRYERVDWNQLAEQDDGHLGIGAGSSGGGDSGAVVVEHPMSPAESREHTEMDEVLDLDCSEPTDDSTSDGDGSDDDCGGGRSRRRQRRWGSAGLAPTGVGSGNTSLADNHRCAATVADVGASTTAAADMVIVPVKRARRKKAQPRPPQRVRKQRRKEQQQQQQQRVRRPPVGYSDDGFHRRWTLRSVRPGYEQLVYDVCNCNETPNVVFATLCYSQHDVYTMVLRNCDGKRRYWYDRPARHGQQERTGDFERAMRWRAATVGRASTSPGYDLAAFLLQNVVTDRRYEAACTTRDTGGEPLVVVTTDDMLTDPVVLRQLVYTSDHRTTPGWEMCCACRATAAVVTHDSASVPTPTCWRHSAAYLTSASADRTFVCNTVVVDLQFMRDDYGEPVCRLRLLSSPTTDGWRVGSRIDTTTVAEFVSLPHDAQPYEFTIDTATRPANPIDLETAHSTSCQDRHANDEDLFPSMPLVGTNGVRYYDTTVGCVVDRMHCLVCKFQR